MSFSLGAMGDSVTDEWSQFNFPGLATWIEFLSISGRADVGEFGSFPTGDPRAASTGKSYAYNFAAHGSNTTNYFGSTVTLPNPMRTVHNYQSQMGSPDSPADWGGIRQLGLDGTIDYLAQFIGISDLLNYFGMEAFGGGARPDLVNHVIDNIVEGLDIATAEGSSPVKVLLLKVQNLSLLPAWNSFGFTQTQRDNIVINLADFNNKLQLLADENGYGIVDLGVLWNQAISTEGLTVRNFAIDPYETEEVGAPLISLDNFYLGDGFHPTPIIHLLLANEVMKTIRDTFDEPGIELYTDKELLHYAGLDVQDKPVANAGDTYALTEYGFLTLDATASSDGDFFDELSYSWDINGDGVFGDAVGVNPTLTWSELEALGIEPDQTYSVQVRVDDGFYIDGVTDSAAVELVVSQAPPPTALAGGPYATNEGIPVGLSGIASLGNITSYAWDFDGDGDYDDATGLNVVFTPADSGIYSIGLRVEGPEGSSTPTATVNVANTAPEAFIIAPLAVPRGELVSFAVIAADFSPMDQAGSFSFEVDWDGDGSTDQTVSLLSGSLVTHSFAEVGSKTIQVRATDKDGSVSGWRSFTFDVLGADQAEGNLFWFGTSGDDEVTFIETEAGIEIHETRLNGQPVNVITVLPIPAGAVFVLARAGSDKVDASGLKTRSVSVVGDSGADVIVGSPLADTINGGEGDDVLSGGFGNDFIIGDADNDLIYGEFLVPVGTPQPKTGELGLDSITGGEGNDTIYGDADLGGGAADVIQGDDGDDLIYGDGAKGGQLAGDSISAGAGNDVVYADAQGGEGSNDFVVGGDGDDYLDGGGGNDLLMGEIGNDILLGGDGAEGGEDSLFGGDGRDILVGDSGSKLSATAMDYIEGGSGEDIIIAGFLTLGTTDTKSFLTDIRAEWTSTRTANQRINNIRGTGTGNRANGSSFLIAGTTVKNDRKSAATEAMVDTVLGQTNSDWFWIDLTEDSRDAGPTEPFVDLHSFPGDV